MADVEISSAVAPPEPAHEAPSSPKQSNGLKRQHDAESNEYTENESKRQRTNGESSLESPRPATANGCRDTVEAKQDATRSEAKEESHDKPTDDAEEAKDTRAAARDRRKASVPDEKQRSKRLFGALLGSLNQQGGETSRRRQEIEARRKAELKKQDEEREAQTARRREETRQWRQRVQQRVDEEEMRARHRNMRERARFLLTSTEPRLYYRPWDLRPDEEDRIDEQIKDAEAQIERETGEFEARKGGTTANERRRTSEAHPPPTDDNDDKAGSEESKADAPAANQDPAKSASTTANNDDKTAAADEKPAEVPESEPTNPDSIDHVDIAQKEDDKMEDPLVDGDEDTAIY